MTKVATVSRELFGTDGVRAIAGEYPLNQGGCVRIGAAVGKLFAKPGQTVVIGYDTRESSTTIVEALVKGLTSQGVNVTSVGVITTPGLAYLTKNLVFVAGVMVTASHNAYQFNGIKVFDEKGGKLSDETEAKLNALIETDITAASRSGTFQENFGLVASYMDFLVSSSHEDMLSGMKVVLDTANGSASSIAGSVFRRLGANVTVLFDTPNGKNINEHCGATDVQALKEAVQELHMGVGVAFDGDADRVIMIDNLGHELKGDHLLYILAVTSHAKGVVATVMSNIGFEQALKKKGILLERTAVGDRYVLEGLEKTSYELGGEQSGHILLPNLLQTGDGILAAIQVLAAVNTSDKTLAEWYDEIPLLPQALVNILLADKKLLDTPNVQRFVAEQEETLGENGRLLIRASGTEPLARVMVEAPNAQEEAERISKGLEQILKGAP